MTDKPKHPLNAFMIWRLSVHKLMRREYPGLTEAQLSKRAGEIWHNLEDKSEWEAKSAQARDAYERAMKEFKANARDSSEKGVGRKRAYSERKLVTRFKKSKQENTNDAKDNKSSPTVSRDE